MSRWRILGGGNRPRRSLPAPQSGSGSVVEHLLAKERVAGSSPVFRSTLLPHRGEHSSTQSPHSATLDDVKSSKRSGTTQAPLREQLLQDFLNLKKSGGISPRSEQWFAWTLKHFFNAFPEPTDITSLSTGKIVEFLGRYNDRRESQHSFYRSLRLFFQWISITYGRTNPFVGQFGNKAIRPPRSLAGKPLAGFYATPIRRIPVLCGTVVHVLR